MMLNIDKIKSKIPKEAYNRWFFYYLIFLIIFSIIWSLEKSPITFRIISLAALIVTQLLYTINVRFESSYERALNWIYFVLIALFGISYIAFSVNELYIAVFTLLSNFAVILVLAATAYFVSLWKSRSLLRIIISYIFLSLTAIVLFSYLFTISSAFPGNELKFNNSTIKLSSWDFIYFGASVFYSNTFGDILPSGYSRLLVILELAFSFVLHIIILGIVVSRFKTNSEKNMSGL